MKVPEIVAFKVKPGRDDDLIKWLEEIGEGERSFFIRQALRAVIRFGENSEGLLNESRIRGDFPKASSPSSDGGTDEVDRKKIEERNDQMDF